MERAYNRYYDINLSLHFSNDGFGSRDGFLDDSAINLLLHKAICRVDNISDFDSLPIAFRTVGTNYKTGEGIIFSSGSFYEALRATMSMPVIFPTVILDDGTYVVDGGIYDNFPVELARELGADIVIAVDVNQAFIQGYTESGKIDTLSGSFMQYMSIATRKMGSESYDDVDYLFIPDTSALGPMDFSDTALALQAGEDCVSENEAIFEALEAELAPWLPLEKGKSYSDFEYPVIKGVVFLDESFSFLSDSLTEDFAGLEYSEETLESLDRRLAMVKRLYGLQSVNYKLVDGYILIQCRDYVSMDSSLHLGLTGGAAAFYDIQNGVGKIALNPNFSISIEVEKERFGFITAIKFGQYNLLSLSTSFAPSRHLAFALDLYGGFGGMSAISDRLYRNRYATRDWNFGAALDLIISAGYSHRFDLQVAYDYYLLGNMENSSHLDVENTVIWAKRNHHVPSLTLSYHMDYSRLQNIDESGFDLRLEGTAGYDDYWFYTLRGDFTMALRLDEAGKLFLDAELSAFTSRGPHELLSSYTVDRFGQLSRDYLYASASFRYGFSFLSGGFYASLGAFAEALNGDDLMAEVPSSDMLPLVMLNKVEAGLVLGFGYLSDFGDFNLSLHLSASGNVSLAFAIR